MGSVYQFDEIRYFDKREKKRNIIIIRHDVHIIIVKAHRCHRQQPVDVPPLYCSLVACQIKKAKNKNKNKMPSSSHGK